MRPPIIVNAKGDVSIHESVDEAQRDVEAFDASRPEMSVQSSRDDARVCCVKEATIFVRLLGKAVDVWRPVNAVRIGDSVYRISAQAVDPLEELEYTPGDIVVCRAMHLDGGVVIAAIGKQE